MTRLTRGTLPPDGRFDVAAAFRFLGSCPTDDELGIAIKMLRNDGIELDLEDFDARRRDL